MANKKVTVIESPKQLKNIVFNLIKDGQSIKEITFILEKSGNYSFLPEVVPSGNVASVVESIVKTFAPYELMQAIMTQHLIAPTNDKESRRFLYNEDTKEIREVRESVFKGLFNDSVLWQQNLLHIPTEYKPHIPLGLTPDKRLFNEWVPPVHWNEAGIYEKHDLPTNHEKFFRHISGYNEASYQFLLEWVTISLKFRNLTYLTLVGMSATGKGTLFRVLQALHGHSNGIESPFAKEISSNFNEILLKRTLVSLNELDKATPTQIDYLKTFNSDEIRGEGKNLAARVLKNTWNIMLSSNNIDCLKPSKDDRRFSIIDSPNKRIEEVFTAAERKALFEDAEEVRKLFCFFMNREFKEESVSFAFKGENAKKVMFFGMEEWERIIIIELAEKFADKAIPIGEVSTKLSDYNCNKKVNQPDLEKLAQDRPGVFEVVRTKNYITDQMPEAGEARPARCIKFKPLAEQKKYYYEEPKELKED